MVAPPAIMPTVAILVLRQQIGLCEKALRRGDRLKDLVKRASFVHQGRGLREQVLQSTPSLRPWPHVAQRGSRRGAVKSPPVDG